MSPSLILTTFIQPVIKAQVNPEYHLASIASETTLANRDRQLAISYVAALHPYPDVSLCGHK